MAVHRLRQAVFHMPPHWVTIPEALARDTERVRTRTWVFLQPTSFLVAGPRAKPRKHECDVSVSHDPSDRAVGWGIGQCSRLYLLDRAPSLGVERLGQQENPEAWPQAAESGLSLALH